MFAEVRLKDVLHPQYLRNVELLSSPVPDLQMLYLLGSELPIP